MSQLGTATVVTMATGSDVIIGVVTFLRCHVTHFNGCCADKRVVVVSTTSPPPLVVVFADLISASDRSP